MTGCHSTQTTDNEWYLSGKKAPMFKGLEGIDFKISTASEEVQAYFNQGMMLSYAFNHAEAARSFYEADRLDSTCAMAHWGYAYVLGPNYNAAMEDGNYPPAYEASLKALSLSKNCTPLEVSLIHALTTRYEAKAPVDRTHLDVAYAAAMKKVYEQYPSDPDIGALYAESLMDLHPWDLYEKQTKKPKAWTPELVSVLEHLIETHPMHPGAHHFYIHALESSVTPEKALPSASLLDTLVPGAGHLVHMPSHIYINTGDYHLGTLANLRAVEVDSVYTTACHAQGVYPLTLYPHNYHFLAATASLEGNSQLAWKAAKKVQEHTATDIMHQPEWGTLKILSVDTSLEEITIWGINTMADLVQIATKVLSGEIAAGQNRFDTSISLLKEAVELEDHLNYNEPPNWFFSVRHHLGAVLLKAGKYKEAEKVYREDLQIIWKRNGWALIGLYHALVGQNKDTEAQSVKSDFDNAWQYADMELVSSSSISH
mgnify:CR=1 FL=1